MIGPLRPPAAAAATDVAASPPARARVSAARRRLVAAMQAQDLATILTAVGGLATAVLGVGVKLRESKAADCDEAEKEAAECRTELQKLRDRYDAAIAHIYAQRKVMREHDIEAPPIPDEAKDE